MDVTLGMHQLKAIRNLRSGSILAGGVGTGKSITSLAYFLLNVCGERLKINGTGEWVPATDPRPLYIITTALKRDNGDWYTEMGQVMLPRGPGGPVKAIPVVVDSWNNLKKYVDVKDAFFIFDEQRLVGSGVWVKSFLKIAENNQWILLSATPGDTWGDYIPVFLANGFYKNRTEFNDHHAVWKAFSRYPKIERYIGTKRLERYRDSILVDMPYDRHTTRHRFEIVTQYDKDLYKLVMEKRWNPYKDQPIAQAGELYYTLRRVVNEDERRLPEVYKLLEKHPRLIVFYNYDYELELLRTIKGVAIAERNGHNHDEVPQTDRWMYLVQYASGSEGWNCIDTNAILFWSNNASWKQMEQAEGRVDRMNTPWKDLYYYRMRTTSRVDTSIVRSLKGKKAFNVRAFERKLVAKTEIRNGHMAKTVAKNDKNDVI